MARRTPSLKRRRYVREPRRRFFVYCEGEKTERAYFNALTKACNNALISVRTFGPAGVPYTLAQSAVECARALGLTKRSRRPRNSFEEHDEVWAVFDRDEHPRYLDAIVLCETNGIGVGYSNPCFEVWLILHEMDFDRPDNRHQVQAQLRALRPEYDPDAGKCPDCADLVKRVEAAEKRAERQMANRIAEGQPPGPPHTTVGRLTLVIRLAALQAQ